MGKKGRKWKESVSCEILIDAINTFSIDELMPVAKVVCGADFAVYYYNEEGPWCHNDEEFRRALRRCVAIGAFDHRATIIRMLNLEENNE